MRSARLALITTLICLGLPSIVVAQTDVAIELGASQIGPAVGADTESARFALGGLRASIFSRNGSGVFASFLGGQVFGDSVGGSFVSGFFEATAHDQWTQRWSGEIDLRFLAFQVKAPFPYRTFAMEMGPSLRYRTPSTSLKLGLLTGVGESHAEFWRRAGGPVFVFDDDHWRVGATGEFLVGSPNVQVGFAGSTHAASGDNYVSAGARLIFGGSWGVVEFRADRWDTPFGYETTGGLSFALPLGGWSIRSFLGRSDPDPLTLAQPGSGSGGVLLGRSLYSTARNEAGEALHEILSYEDGSSRVRLTIEAPPGVSRVEVLGDFTLWDPVPMRRDGDRWITELDVPTGTHHFGFLVDDQWFVPDDAPDVVPDEWGRSSATLVIEGAG